MSFPGTPWLGSINAGAGNWNDHARSFQCYWSNGQVPSGSGVSFQFHCLSPLWKSIANVPAKSSESAAASASMASVIADSAVAGFYGFSIDVVEG